MKRFMLFTWDTYYPRGGLHDLAGTFDSVEEAVAQATKECYQVVASPTLEVVKEVSYSLSGEKRSDP